MTIECSRSVHSIVGGYNMPKSSNQKLKLIYLMKILLERTDETHSITMPEIIDALAAYDISAERKSLYNDIENLRVYGLDVIGTQEDRTYSYHIGNRQFELAELKLLVDSVQSAKFITAKKSNELIKKIEGFASKYEASQLQRQVFVAGRVKTMNESIYYNVDRIHTAIAENSRITFQYFQWNVDKKMELRHDGALYEVSPWSLSWDDENYYIVAYDDLDQKIKHYRVDKMMRISILEEMREGKDLFKNFDMATYSKTTFGMYSGQLTKVHIQFKNEMCGVFIDRFGKEISFRKIDDEYSQVSVDVAVSPQFFGWIFSLGKDVKVTGLTQQLFYANGVKYLMNNLTCENSIIQVNGGNKTVFDFNGGGVTAKLDINKSTIYANPQHTGALYSSQGGQKATDAGLKKQTISILNSTLYNIAYNKNVNNHRQANQTWLEYIVKDNIVLDCGKKGQFVRGLNGGQNGKNPTWAIDRNTFLFTVDGIITNTGAEESTNDSEEPITNSLITNPAFTDAANGDFHIGKSTQQAKFKTGDPRWLVEYEAGELNKAELENEITAATTLLGNASTEEGTPGATLLKAINDAKTALANAEFQEEIDAALAALKAAEEAYRTASGISNITTDADADNGAWYNLNGVRIEKPTQKGIYIHNGKKVIR